MGALTSHSGIVLEKGKKDAPEAWMMGVGG